MDVSRRRVGVKTSVVAGSVWETRMKSDEVKGGIKVFNGEESSNLGENGEKRIVAKRSQAGSLVAVSGKRKTWKSESFEGPIQIARGKTPDQEKRNLDERCKELSVSVDGGIKRSPVLTKKGRSDRELSLSLSVDAVDKSLVQVKKGRSDEVIEKSPIQIRKTRSETAKVSVESCKEIVEFGNSLQLRKSKSESIKAVDQSGNGIVKNSVQLRKTDSASTNSLENSGKDSPDKSDEGNEQIPAENEKNGSEETSNELDVCQDKVISSDVTNVSVIKSPPKMLVTNDGNIDDAIDDDDNTDEVFDEEEEEEIGEVDVEVEVEIEKKSVDIKEINVPEQKPFPKVVVSEEKKTFSQFNNKTVSFTSSVNKQPPPLVKRATIYPNFTKPSTSSVADEYHSFPQTHNKLQNLVDLVMWRDVSKSAFVFGIGTFIIISSSYTTDLNISFISVISYLGLVYLAVIFLYRAIICRGYIDIDDTSYVLGEEEAIWLLKLFLPYLNEFLMKLKALFSGDPATTMKLAVLLFVLARCGSSITIWKMAKLGFFGVFIIPKVCSSYSTQLTAYGKFWIRRFRDAWDSCSHKKAVAAAVFTLVWNLSSIVARIWAVFMLFVAVRYYQQSMVRDDWVVEEVTGAEETSQGAQVVGQKEAYRPNKEGTGLRREWRRSTTIGPINKTKKGF